MEPQQQSSKEEISATLERIREQMAKISAATAPTETKLNVVAESSRLSENLDSGSPASLPRRQAGGSGLEAGLPKGPSPFAEQSSVVSAVKSVPPLVATPERAASLPTPPAAPILTTLEKAPEIKITTAATMVAPTTPKSPSVDLGVTPAPVPPLEMPVGRLRGTVTPTIETAPAIQIRKDVVVEPALTVPVGFRNTLNTPESAPVAKKVANLELPKSNSSTVRALEESLREAEAEVGQVRADQTSLKQQEQELLGETEKLRQVIAKTIAEEAKARQELGSKIQALNQKIMDATVRGAAREELEELRGEYDELLTELGELAREGVHAKGGSVGEGGVIAEKLRHARLFSTAIQEQARNFEAVQDPWLRDSSNHAAVAAFLDDEGFVVA